MKRTEFLMFVMFSLLLFSCNQEDNGLLGKGTTETANYDVITGKIALLSNDLEDGDSIGVIKFTYNGKTYVSDCVFGDKFQIKYETIRGVFDELNNIPNVAIEVKPDGSIEFYDSKEELDYTSKLRNQYPLTKAEFDPDGSYIRNFELRLWEHAKGRKKGGKNTHFYSNGIQGNKSPAPAGYNEAYMTRIGFNNNISSCQMWGEVHMTNVMGCQSGQYKSVRVTFYDGDFTGKTLTFDDITVKKTYSERDYFSGFGFNDLTSSFTISYY